MSHTGRLAALAALHTRSSALHAIRGALHSTAHGDSAYDVVARRCAFFQHVTTTTGEYAETPRELREVRYVYKSSILSLQIGRENILGASGHLDYPLRGGVDRCHLL